MTVKHRNDVCVKKYAGSTYEKVRCREKIDVPIKSNIIGNAHMTRCLWLVALESKAGRHVYGESMHLSILLWSKI